MKLIKEYFKKNFKKTIFNVFSLLVLFISFIVFNHYKNLLPSQKMSDRWSYEDNKFSQVSVFLSNDYKADKSAISDYKYKINMKLIQQGVSKTKSKENFNMTYSTFPVSLNIKSEKANLEVDSIFVGENFFKFHPYEILSGYYFKENETLERRIIIDDYAAWELFGSTDLYDVPVEINGFEYKIAGVIKRETDKVNDKTYPKKHLVYILYDNMTDLEVESPINSIESVIPEPVKGFAKGLVNEYYKEAGVNEFYFKVVNNTNRYNYDKLFKIITSFGARAIVDVSIKFPYWENSARVVENYLSLVFLLQLIIVVYWFIKLLILIIKIFTHKNFNLKFIINLFEKKIKKLKERKERS